MILTRNSTPAQVQATVLPLIPQITEALESGEIGMMRPVYYSIFGVTYGTFIAAPGKERTALTESLRALLEGKATPIRQTDATGKDREEGVYVDPDQDSLTEDLPWLDILGAGL